tara:strand:- start:14 stop:592 length:579 start_codon:yes stop_codon:yes gene_type:complete
VTLDKSQLRIFFGIVALQLIILIGIIGFNEFSMRTGTLVVLETVPLDPKEDFSEDSVELLYEINKLDSDLFDKPSFRRGQDVVVALKRQDDVWVAVGVSDKSFPNSEVEIDGRVTFIEEADNSYIEVEYGIESYFIPRGIGPETELKYNQNELAGIFQAEVLVDRFRRGRVRRVLIDGSVWDSKLEIHQSGR